MKKILNNKFFKLGMGILLLGAALVIGLFIGGFFNKTDKAGDTKARIAEGTSEYAKETPAMEDAVSISVPGYDTLKFVAGQTNQKVVLHNPSENKCYFKMSLILENGEEIWTSDLLEPGMAFTSIELNRKLEKGEYMNVKLKYDCFSLKDRTQLNGAEIKVVIKAE